MSVEAFESKHGGTGEELGPISYKGHLRAQGAKTPQPHCHCLPPSSGRFLAGGRKMILPLITTRSVQQVARPRVLPPGKPDSKRLNACCPSPMSKAEFQGNRSGGATCSRQGHFRDFRHAPLSLAEKTPAQQTSCQMVTWGHR